MYDGIDIGDVVYADPKYLNQDDGHVVRCWHNKREVYIVNLHLKECK